MGHVHRSAVALAVCIGMGCAKFSGEEHPDAAAAVGGGVDGGMVVDANTDAASTEGGVLPSGYAAEVLADKPVLYWSLGEPSGDFADLGPFGYAATPVGAQRGEPALVKGGDPSVRLGVGQAIESLSGDTPELRFGRTSAYTLECWVKVEALTGAVQDFVVRGTADTGISLYLSKSGEVSTFRGKSGAATTHGNVPLMVGKEHHLAATFDGKALRLYVDGENGGPSDVTLTEVDLPENSNLGVTVGRVTGFPPSMQGWIDEIAIYRTALSPERIRAHASFRP